MALSGVADLAGRVLADRYRLLASIGAGGSGRVYIADDVRLRRRVAVKVLHAALADDAGFLRRFRSEAQLAASLHHPNVVAVYDWGDDGVPFMVLELLSGGSLRAVLDEGLRLTPSQAAYVGRQVTAALQYAHSRGLVHRDIKPANLLFDEHGVVRVADFGLARALAEASWTEPAGALVGTARYAAPEQGTGASLDGRADLYSLAVVLVEAVTGQVPDLADTPIGTLAGRANSPLIAPDALGPLGAVVERAGRPDPSERYPDAATMGDALADAIRQLPPPGPLTLIGVGTPADDPHPTQLRRTAALFDQDADSGPVAVEDDATVVAEPIKAAGEPARYAPRAVPVVVASLVVAVLVAAGFLFARSAGGSAVAAPQLVGLTQRDAAARAADSRVVVKVQLRRADDPKGIVIGQRPAPGSWIGDGSTVRLIVSSGPTPVGIPGVRGKTELDATRMLNAAGFGVSPERRNDEQIPAGTVIGTEPPGGAKQAPDTTVKLIVSDGPAPVKVPDVSGKSYDEAASILQGVRFEPVRRDEFSSTVENGKVIGTDPPADQLARRDSRVTIRVSKGPELVQVPFLRGLPVEQATQTLQNVGLLADVQNYGPGKPVRAQDPAAGIQIVRGTKVTLFL